MKTNVGSNYILPEGQAQSPGQNLPNKDNLADKNGPANEAREEKL